MIAPVFSELCRGHSRALLNTNAGTVAVPVLKTRNFERLIFAGAFGWAMRLKMTKYTPTWTSKQFVMGRQKKKKNER